MRKPSGYWEKRENVIKELTKVISEIGHYPTTSELRGMGYGYLEDPIYRHGGSNSFRAYFGYDTKKFTKVNWKDMTNNELIKYGINRGYKGLTITDLLSIDRKYYEVLHKRKLTDSIIRRINRPLRLWYKMTDEEVLDYGIKAGYKGLSPSDIGNKDKNYITELRKRGLVNKILKSSIRNFKDMSNEEIIAYAKKLKYDKMTRSGLYRKDSGFYNLLVRRGILKTLIRKQHREWKKMTDDEVIKYGKGQGYSTMKVKDLQNIDGTFIHILSARHLTRRFFEYKIRWWGTMTDDEVIKYGIERGYKNLKPSEISNIDSGYYAALSKRKLVYSVAKCPQKQPRNWKKMSDEEIIKYGKDLRYDGLKPVQLLFKDPGYYIALRKRGLFYHLLIPANLTSENFIDFAENNEVAKLIIEKFGNDKSAMIDLLVVTTKSTKSKIAAYLDEPSLRPYLGKYYKGINNIKDLKELEEKIPFDEKGVVERIIKNAALNFMRKKLGIKPSRPDIQNFEKDLQASLYET